MPDGIGYRTQRGEQLVPAFHVVEVADRQPYYSDQIGRRPVALHKGLAHADIAPEERAPEKAFLVDNEHRPQIGSRRAEAVGVLGTNEFQKSFFDAAQELQEKALG